MISVLFDFIWFECHGTFYYLKVSMNICLCHQDTGNQGVLNINYNSRINMRGVKFM